MKVMDFEAQLAVNGSAELDGTKVTVNGLQGVTEDEARAYIEHLRKQYPHDTITTLEISAEEDGNVGLNYTVQPPKFQRIRRITGYLVGTLDRFNNAKRAEEHDRLKHGLESREGSYAEEIRDSCSACGA